MLLPLIPLSRQTVSRNSTLLGNLVIRRPKKYAINSLLASVLLVNVVTLATMETSTSLGKLAIRRPKKYAINSLLAGVLLAHFVALATMETVQLVHKDLRKNLNAKKVLSIV